MWGFKCCSLASKGRLRSQGLKHFWVIVVYVCLWVCIEYLNSLWLVVLNILGVKTLRSSIQRAAGPVFELSLTVLIWYFLKICYRLLLLQNFPSRGINANFWIISCHIWWDVWFEFLIETSVLTEIEGNKFGIVFFLGWKPHY